MFKVNQANKIHSGRVESVYPPFRRILQPEARERERRKQPVMGIHTTHTQARM